MKNKDNNKRTGDDNKNGSKRQRREISSLITNNDAAFQAIAESQLALTAALSNLTTGGPTAQVGSTIIAPLAVAPQVTFASDQKGEPQVNQVQLVNAAQVADVKLQGILSKKSKGS